LTAGAALPADAAPPAPLVSFPPPPLVPSPSPSPSPSVSRLSMKESAEGWATTGRLLANRSSAAPFLPLLLREASSSVHDTSSVTERDLRDQSQPRNLASPEDTWSSGEAGRSPGGCRRKARGGGSPGRQTADASSCRSGRWPESCSAASTRSGPTLLLLPRLLSETLSATKIRTTNFSEHLLAKAEQRAINKGAFWVQSRLNERTRPWLSPQRKKQKEKKKQKLRRRKPRSSCSVSFWRGLPRPQRDGRRRWLTSKTQRRKLWTLVSGFESQRRRSGGASPE